MKCYLIVFLICIYNDFFKKPLHFHRDCIDYRSFGEYCYRTSIISVQGHMMSFHLFRYSLISFKIILLFYRTSSKMLNLSGESRHPWLIPELKKKAFSFSSLSVIWAMGFSQMSFIKLRNFPFILCLLVFLSCQCFLYVPWDDHVALSPWILLRCKYCIDWFLYT